MTTGELRQNDKADGEIYHSACCEERQNSQPNGRIVGEMAENPAKWLNSLTNGGTVGQRKTEKTWGSTLSGVEGDQQ
jgi:hypothetical protein